MGLQHACRAEKAAAMPWIEKARAALNHKAPDKLAGKWAEMPERERVFWMRAAGMADAAERGAGRQAWADMTPEQREAVRAVLKRSAERARALCD